MQIKCKSLFLFLLLNLLWGGFSEVAVAQPDIPEMERHELTDIERHEHPEGIMSPLMLKDMFSGEVEYDIRHYSNLFPRLIYFKKFVFDSLNNAIAYDLTAKLKFTDVCRSIEDGINYHLPGYYNSANHARPSKDDFYRMSSGSTYKNYMAWKKVAQLRQGADGSFVNAADRMWNEIERLNTIDQRNKTRREAGEQQTDCFAGTWANIGPFFNSTTDDATAANHNSITPGIGRVAVLRKHPTQDILYMGAATGGLWKSVPNGATEPIGHRWQVVGAGSGDLFPTMGIADIAFNSTGSTMYVATGDRTRGFDALGQNSYSIGVLKSTDAGTTWQRLSNNVTWRMLVGTTYQTVTPKYLKINRLLVNANGDLFIAANIFVDVLEKIVGASTNTANNNVYGVWKYNTANNSWEQLVHFDNEVCAMEFGNAAQTAIVAASVLGQVQRTTTLNTTWTSVLSAGSNVTKGVSFSNVVQNGSENILYLMTTSPFTLSKSTDGGATFTPTNLSISSFPLPPPNDGDITSFEVLPTGPRSVVTINPSNVNELYLGAAGNTAGSDANGGKLVFKVIMSGNNVVSTTAVSFSPKDSPNVGASANKYMHTDLNNFLWIGNKLFIAHDGGLSYTSDGGTTWSKWYETTRDLCITEALSVSSSVAAPTPGLGTSNTDCVYAGSWDNGLFRAKRNGNAFEWFNSFGGDAVQICMKGDNRIGYTLLPNGGIFRYRPAIPDNPVTAERFKGLSIFPPLSTASVFAEYIPDIKLFDGLEVLDPASPNTPNQGGLMSGYPDLIRINPNITAEWLGETTTCCNYSAFNPPTGFQETEYPWAALDMVGSVAYAGRIRLQNTGLNTDYVARTIITRSNDANVGYPPANPPPTTEPYPTWTLKDGTNLPNAPGKLLTDIVVNKLNPDMLFATYSGFDINGEMTVETMSNPQTTLQLGKVFMSTNGGDTWTNITFGAIKPAAPNSLPKNMLPDLPVLCAALYTPDASTWHLFIGTDVGVYYTNNTLTNCTGTVNWFPFSGGLPRISVQELEVVTSGTTPILRAATFGRGIWETTLTGIGGANCACASCGSDAYPLIANITVVPNQMDDHPENYLAPDWTSNISSNTEIRLLNGSSSTFGNNACTWSFSGAFVQQSLTDCSGNPITSLANYHGDCLVAIWTNDFAMPQTITATLQVTDVGGCTASTTTNLVINPFDPDCEIGNSVSYELLPSHTICDNDGLCKTLVPAGTGTGSVKITPNIFAGSGEFQYQLDKLDGTGAIVSTYLDNNVRAIWQPNGNLSFECLEPANYSLLVTDQATACTDELNLSITNDGAMTMALTDEVKNSYRVCLVSAGQSPDKRTGKITISAINGTPIEELYNDYTFAWSDCASCTQPIRDNLAKGTYTVTVTHRPTGCTYTKTYEVVYNNIQVVSGGFVVDNGGISINDPEPALRIDAPSVFDDQAQVRLELPQDMYLNLKVYNTNGVMVKQILDNELKTKGVHFYMHNATNLPNGLYTYVVKGCEEQKTDTGFKY
ncbi:MAG: hypothetical protein IPN94_05615 [Sphingobacteriales bacterium]|jgi:hypothetical protein|nr:hypothetical protein [Sphingobacteriales bacterium]